MLQKDASTTAVQSRFPIS